MNLFLDVAPDAQVAHTALGCMVSVDDLADRPPAPLAPDATLDLGGRRLRSIHTPHVPHGWDAHVVYEEITGTLFCGDLLSQFGDGPAVTGGDVVAAAVPTEDAFGSTCLTPHTAPTIRRLADLEPTSLAIMHGSSYTGGAGTALNALADEYEQRLATAGWGTCEIAVEGGAWGREVAMSNLFHTHEVTNQPPPLAGYDVFGADAALVEALDREGAGWAAAELHELGLLAGHESTQELGRLAEANRPELRSHDRYGNRIDVVDYHPAYHDLMSTAIGHGLHAAPWSDGLPGAHVARAAKVITWYQVDGGHICPISMTYSVVPALRHNPDLAAEWEPRICSRFYDPTDAPASEKTGATCGMAMTEKQGGSDVRSNTTVARPDGQGTYRLTGHKWFCSAPMSDGFLMLAQAPGGLSCFWVPRWTPDGSRNPIAIQRLKDKLGDRSNASSEIELLDTWATPVGDEGRGVRTIIEMVSHTRLDCTLGSAAIMRHGVAQATWHAHHRSAFGATLDEQPLMVNVLADLAVESEAATAAALRLARAFDAAPGDESEAALVRLVTPVVKYWTCKRAPQHAAEALECLGGAGFVEESEMPRIYRQSPVNGVWEGSGNVICLDVLRALARAPEVLDAYWAEVDEAAGGDARLDLAVIELRKQLADAEALEARARIVVEKMAVVFQGSLLVRHAPVEVSDAFCASRLGAEGGRAFGTLPPGIDGAAIVDRARPAGVA